MLADPNSNPVSAESGDAAAPQAWLESGLIRQRLVGDQTTETVAELTRQTETLVEQLRAKQEPVLILSDYTEVGDTTQGSREELKRVLGTRYFDRIAVFGVPAALRIVGELMLSIIGKRDQVQIFSTREDAQDWLREFRQF